MALVEDSTKVSQDAISDHISAAITYMETA
jgi:hypothetical protein